MKLGCVVLASGKGRRFAASGGVGNKLLVSVGGVPLVCRTVASVPSDLFEIVLSTRWPEVAGAVERAGLSRRLVLHDTELRSDSIRAGLNAGAKRWDGCLFLPGDQPLVSHASFCALIRAFADDPSRAYRLSWGEVPASPVLFPAACFESLVSLSGNQGGGALLLDAKTPVSLVSAAHEWELWDVDTLGDVQRIEGVLHPQG